MREAAQPAIGASGFYKIEVRVSMGESRTPRNAEPLEQSFANEMRWLTSRGAYTDADIGLAKGHGKKLRVTIGEVKQCDFTWRRRQRVKRIRAIHSTTRRQ